MHTEAFVRVNGELKRVSELDEGQKRRLAAWLKRTYLNELFRGRAVFSEETEKSGEDGD